MDKALVIGSNIKDGWFDDGSESGVIRTDRKSIVIMPFVTSLQAISTGASNDSQYFSVGGAEISNGGSITVALNTGTGNYSQRSFSFRGTILGILHTGANNIPYSVIIDGVVYKAGTANNKNYFRWDTQAGYPMEFGYLEIIDANLTNTEHQAQIIMQGNASSTTTMVFLGLGLSRDAGYVEPPPSVWRIGSFAVPLASTTLSTLTGLPLKSVSKYTFYNSSASPVTVTLLYVSTVVFAQSVPAGQSIDWDFRTPQAIDTSLWNVQASAASAITMSIFGRY